MLSFIISLVSFLVISTVLLYFSGRLVLGKRTSDTSPEESFYISLIFGVAIIIFETIVTGILGVRFLSLPLLLLSVLISIFLYRQDFFKSLYSIVTNKTLIILIVLGVLIQGFINFPSGWRFADGMNFWSSQGHDGLWHVSLIEEIKIAFPPTMPLYAGHPLQNYHFSSDIFMGEFYRLFPVFTSLDLYFRYYPILFSFLIGLGVFVFAKRHWNEGSAYWAMFFTYFCGSFGFIASLINGNSLFAGETTFWASQGNTILGNPPHALGIILLTAILLMLSIWHKHNKNFWLVSMFIVGFGLATVKVSSGAVLIAGALGAGFYLLLIQRQVKLFILGVLLAIGNFAMLKVISPTAESFLIFEPLWFPRTMMVVRLNWMDWEMRRQHYYWVNTLKGDLHGMLLELQAILIFVIGNTGARIIGLVSMIKSIVKKMNPVDVFMISGSGFALLVVLLFVQKGVTFNLIQFIQIYLHFLGMYAGSTVFVILKRIKSSPLKIAFAVMIIALAIPTAVGNLFDFYGPGRKPLAIISNSEIDALNWLKDNTPTDSVIFTKPFDKNAHYRYSAQPMPINAWYPTMYVHSISMRKTFLTGEEQLAITGYDTEKDLNEGRQFMKQVDVLAENKFLSEKNIDYLYFRHDELDTPINEKNQSLKQVFNNGEAVIYKYVQTQ